MFSWADRAQRFANEGNFCAFGITEAIFGAALFDTVAAGAVFDAAAGAEILGAGSVLGGLSGAAALGGVADAAALGGGLGAFDAALPGALSLGEGFAGELPSIATTGVGGGAVTPLGSVAAPATGALPTAAPIGASALAPSAPLAAGPLDVGATGAFDAPLFSSTSTGAGDLAANAGITGAGGAGGGGGGAVSGASGFSSGLDSAIKEATGGFLGKSDLGSILGAGQLGMSLLKGQQPLPGSAQINAAAGTVGAASAGLVGQGQTLTGYLQSGTLPPGVQQGIDQAAASAKASVRAQHAQHGTSGSSAEAQELANVDSLAATQGATIATQLLQQGVSEISSGISGQGLSAQIYQYLLQNALTQDQQLGQAIGSFASSLAAPAQTITFKASPSA